MDPFAVIMLGGSAGVVVALYLLGRFYPGSGADVVDWKPTRSPEVEAQNDIDDLEALMQVANRRRRRLGQQELTEDTLDQLVQESSAERTRRSEEYLADLEIEQMLEVKNRRRAAKGLPPISAEEYRARIEGDEL
ncbi:hypothetical protein [Paraconexibacter algicola]|uniref:Uncharacterized protein n=1 Tax=Paraconexibacter algicola TaxID=2133960 RepID=A0A2T4UF19_9ACTN|nr:hypothetical protein [Paraconexibacter algicola]PTL56322.1 hypothetical protein C7Y72_15235 [Paraconexibacter algicola]